MPYPKRLITCRGETLSVDEWSRKSGIPRATIISRIDALGWSPADAVSVPKDRRFSRGGRHKAKAPRPCPAMKEHRASGKAYVEWTEVGKRHFRYFGEFGSPGANAAYLRFRREWDEGIARLKKSGGSISVTSLCDAYDIHAANYYQKLGKQTSQVAIVKSSISLLLAVAIDLDVSEISPDTIRAMQQEGIRRDLSRRTINKYQSVIVSMLSWGVGRSLVDPGVYGVCQRVEFLQAGRTRAIELEAVESVPWRIVEATLPKLHRSPPRQQILEDAIRLHWLLGCRSSQLLTMRPMDIDRSSSEWKYVVHIQGDKNAHRRKGNKKGIYFIGPKGQSIISKYIDSCPRDRPIFSLPPRKHGNPWVILKPGRYRSLIALACRAAGVDHWFPHQMRHSRASEIQRQYENDEAAAAAIGDTPEVAREVYIDPNDAVRRRIAREMG